MKIKNITLDEDELPETITVVMTVAEAALITRLVGGLAPDTVIKTLGSNPRWVEAVGSIYNALAGSVFNRFWDDGVNDVIPVWPHFNERLNRK